MAGVKQFTIFTKFAVKNAWSGPVLGMAKGADKLAMSTDRALKVVGKFGKGVLAVGKYAAAAGGAAIAASAGIFALAKSSAEAADDILNTSAALGLSTDALQEYRYAGIAAGLTTEEMDAALRKLTVNLGKDSEDVSNALYQIGLSAEDLKAAGPDRSLDLIANGFQSITDPTKKAAVATALFGKSSVRMVNALSKGSKGIADLRAEAQEIGYVLGGDALENAGKLDDTLDRFGATATGLGNRMAAKVIPQVTKFVESLSKGIQPGGKFEKIIDSVGTFLGKGGDFVGPFLDKIIQFVPKLAGFASGILDALQPVIKPLMAIFEPVFKIFENMMPLITGLVGVVSNILGPILETIKFILEGVALITAGGAPGGGPAGAGGVAPASFGMPGGGAPRFSTPVSSQTSLVTSNTTTNRSTLDVNVSAPPGTSSKLTGSAPDITLNTGQTRSFSPVRKR